ncbi:unnamed protein product, partial [Urochloa humidicola]
VLELQRRGLILLAAGLTSHSISLSCFFLCPETVRAELRRASLLGSGHLRRIPSNHSSSTSPATSTTKPLAQPSLPAPGIADLTAAIAAVRPSSALLAVILAVLHP